MHHEPNGSCPPLQLIADRRCPACWTVRPLDDLSAQPDMPTGCCVACRRRSAAVARRRQLRTLRQVARRVEAGYRALLAEVQRGGGDAA
jgi:hypothetical protein